MPTRSLPTLVFVPRGDVQRPDLERVARDLNLHPLFDGAQHDVIAGVPHFAAGAGPGRDDKISPGRHRGAFFLAPRPVVAELERIVVLVLPNAHEAGDRTAKL